MLEQPTNLRTTRSGGILNRSLSHSPQRGRVLRGQRGGARNIQPIVWNQNQQDMQIIGGKLAVGKLHRVSRGKSAF